MHVLMYLRGGHLSRHEEYGARGGQPPVRSRQGWSVSCLFKLTETSKLTCGEGSSPTPYCSYCSYCCRGSRLLLPLLPLPPQEGNCCCSRRRLLSYWNHSCALSASLSSHVSSETYVRPPLYYCTTALSCFRSTERMPFVWRTGA